jgi:signal transduction histidine kinase
MHNMKRLLFCILSVTLSLSAFAQDVDSLYAAFNKAKGDERLRIANEMIKIFHELQYTKDTIFANDRPLQTLDADMAKSMSWHLNNQDRNREALELAEKAMALYEQQNDTLGIAQSKYYEGLAYNMLGQYDKALELLIQSYETFLVLGDEKWCGMALFELGGIYYIIEDYENATKFYKQSIEIERRLGDFHFLAVKLASLGTVYSEEAMAEDISPELKQAKFEAALTVTLEALELARQYSPARTLGGGLLKLSRIYVDMNEFGKAMPYIKEAVAIFEEQGSDYGMGIAFSYLGLAEMGEGHHAKAEEYYIKAIELAEKVEDNENLMSYLGLASQATEDTNPAKALEYYRRKFDLYQSIHKKEGMELANDFQVKYETREKQLEIERQQLTISRQNTQRIALVAGLALAVVIIVLALNMVRLRKKRNTELVEMNATKDKFFSIISHDLKNPALAQRNALQSLVEHASELDAASLQVYYGELLKSADGQVELLYNLLNWAQVQTDRMPYHPSSFDLGETARTEIHLLDLLFRNKGLRLVSEIPAHPTAFGDRTMIGTVIRNLLTNAAKFTPSGGEIRLTVHEQQADYLVSVEDSGVGMSAEKVSQLFQLDNQSSTAGTNGEQGSGLGLIVCKELVEKNGGALSVVSEVGYGSAFRFSVGKGEINYEL